MKADRGLECGEKSTIFANRFVLNRLARIKQSKEHMFFSRGGEYYIIPMCKQHHGHEWNHCEFVAKSPTLALRILPGDCVDRMNRCKKGKCLRPKPK